MDSTSDDAERVSTKNFLRALPVWEILDKVKKELSVISTDLDLYRKRQQAIQSRISLLRTEANGPPQDSNLNVPHSPVHNGQEAPSERPSFNNGLDGGKPSVQTPWSALATPISVNQKFYAMQHRSSPWVLSKVISVSRSGEDRPGSPKMIILVFPDDKSAPPFNVNEFALARTQNPGDLKITKRVIAGETTHKLTPGIVASEPCPQNGQRYLVLMDSGSAHYFKQDQVYPILAQSSCPWHDPKLLGTINSFNYMCIRDYFSQYPRRTLVVASRGSKIELYRNGMIVSATIVSSDCEIIRVKFLDGSIEEVYRGSPRLQKRREVLLRQLYLMKNLDDFYPRVLQCITKYEKVSEKALEQVKTPRNTARKSTSNRRKTSVKVKVKISSGPVDEELDCSEELDLDDIEESKTHQCDPECLVIPGVRTEVNVDDIVRDFSDVTDIKVPLLLGWKRRLRQIPSKSKPSKSRLKIVYESPCGKLFAAPYAIKRYLYQTNSKMDIDYFTFDRDLTLNREVNQYVEALYFLDNVAKCRTSGLPLENKNIRVLNQFSKDGLAQDFTYRPDRFPHSVLESQGFSFNEEFKSSCDCLEDCSQRIACFCHRLNEDFYGVDTYHRGAVETRCNYVNKRLLAQVPTGIFECNSLCSCSSKCSNRVVQNGIRVRLQIQKTIRKGWGVHTLDDIPAGAFICTYSAELLDDADKYGKSDMYYADLDFISANQQAKEIEAADEHESPKFIDIHTILGSHDYTLDSRRVGNVGRFFNHSCDPNSFVQNVFIETHDLRFPIVAFFASRTIKALEEITWNYNYRVGSIPGREMACYCGAAKCAGRIL